MPFERGALVFAFEGLRGKLPPFYLFCQCSSQSKRGLIAAGHMYEVKGINRLRNAGMRRIARSLRDGLLSL
jgi:hypothetical protein